MTNNSAKVRARIPHGVAARACVSGRDNGAVAIRVDCRHYSVRTVGPDDRVERCRVDAAEAVPFACPDHCLFFEPRPISDAGWQQPR